ncbi:MAG: ComF family protein [Muribaculaceae bacterium]|nr:ComF family protein [Muribaculaceae bacterium]
MVGRVAEPLLQLLFPPRCAVCDGLLAAEEFSAGIHGACGKKLFPVGESFCMHCGQPLGGGKEYCLDCAGRFFHGRAGSGEISYIVQGRGVFEYRGAVKKTMYRFKYSNRREYAAFLGEAAARRWGDWIFANGIEAVVPVPMYRGKKRRRGYDQAELFAGELAGRMGLVCESRALKRTVNTRPQKKLNVEERKNNLKNAFQTAPFIVQYKRVLLVDDIYTTGSTVEAAAKELRRAGVEQVYFLAACIGRGL